MLDIHTLERRWIKYKLKQYAPYGIALLFGLIVLFIFAYKTSNQSPLPSITESPITAKKKIVSETPKSHSISANTLEPSMEFIQSFQTQVPPIQPTAVPAKNIQPSTQSIPAPKVLNVPDSSTLKSLPVPPIAANDKPVSMNKNEAKFDIDALERRFKETSNPNLGLFIARYYYDHGNYSDAYNFALKTNSLNNKMEESWIIFAKSLVKLGKIDQAKKTLQVYISESGSDSARALLNAIDQGTFK